MVETRLSSPVTAVLRIRDVYPGSEFFHPGSGIRIFPSRIFIFPSGSRIQIFSIPDPGIRIKEQKYLTQKILSKLSEIWSGLVIPDPDPDFLPIPDPQHCQSQVLSLLIICIIYLPSFLYSLPHWKYLRRGGSEADRSTVSLRCAQSESNRGPTQGTCCRRRKKAIGDNLFSRVEVDKEMPGIAHQQIGL